MIKTFDLGSVKSITKVPAIATNSQYINWESYYNDGIQFKVTLSFGNTPGERSQNRCDLVLFEGPNYKANPTEAEVIARATQLLNIQ